MADMNPKENRPGIASNGETDTNSVATTAPSSSVAEQQHQQQQQQQQMINGGDSNQAQSYILDLKNEQCRLETFKNWPNPNISPRALAKAGFYYINRADQVKCAWCQGIIAKWEKNDNAFNEHQRFFPECPRVKLGPLIEIASDGIRDLGIQQITPPRKPKFSSLDARLRTYARWPISDIQNPEILAQAGFYYQEIDDQVRCFHCNGGLRSWQKEDDPWFEHAKWFPTCPFLKLVKGQAYINQVQEIGRQSTYANTTTNSEPVGGGTRLKQLQQQQQQPQQQQQTPITLDEAMILEPVRQALEMGLNEGRIRNATKRHLDCYGKPFETTEELVEAVLEGQVNEEDDGSTDLSSSIVREVSRILNNIFNPRNRSDSDDFDENTSSFAEDDENIATTPAAAVEAATEGAGFYHRDQQSEMQQPIASNESLVSSTASATVVSVPDMTSTTSTNSLSAYCEISHEIQPTPSTITVATASTNVNGTKQSYSDPDHLKKQLSLEEENRKLKDARLCKVCMDEEVGVVFLPCGHLVTCVQCAPGVNACPLCRSAIKGLVRTFLS